MKTTPPKAVFVDRDGTLNEMVYDSTHGLFDSPRRPEQVRMKPGAGRFLCALRQAGYRIVVVSNQPGLAKGTLTMRDLRAVNRRLAALLAADGGQWDDFLFCPHHPVGGTGCRAKYVRNCRCRKPGSGMLLDAAREHGLALRRCWMVGDGLNDIQAGRSVGCRTILVAKLKIEQIERFTEIRDARPHAVAADLDAALRMILHAGASRTKRRDRKTLGKGRA